MTRTPLAVIVCLGSLVCSCSSTPRALQREAMVQFCNFTVSSELERANYSSLVIYTFELTDEGRPTKVVPLKDDFVGEEVVTECLRGWRFTGYRPGQQLRVVFVWTHGVGWTQISVSDPQSLVVLEVTGDRCPYAD